MDKDIVKAIEAEQEYIQTSNSDEFPLRNRVAHFGYDNLDDYFYDKIKYKIVNENLTIKSYHMEDGVADVFKTLQAGGAGAFTVNENSNRTWIWAGRDNVYLDVDKANEFGYSIRNFNYHGGPIITTNDDFSLALVLPNHIDLDISLFIADFIKILSKFGYSAYSDNNDILVEGKKVFGSTMYKDEKSTLIAFQLSLTDHTDIIDELSLKEIVKQPGYLNINRYDIEKEVNKWLHTI